MIVGGMLDELMRPENITTASAVVGGVVGTVLGMYTAFNLVATPQTMSLMNEHDRSEKVKSFRDLPNKGILGRLAYAFDYVGMHPYLAEKESS